MNKLFKIHQKEAKKILTSFLLEKENNAKDIAPEIFFIISEVRKDIFQDSSKAFLPEVEQFFLTIIPKDKRSLKFFVAAAWLASFFLRGISHLVWGSAAIKDENFKNIPCQYQKKSDPRHIQNSQLLILSDVVSGFVYDMLMSSTLKDKEKSETCEKIAVFLEEQHLKRVNDLRK